MRIGPGFSILLMVFAVGLAGCQPEPEELQQEGEPDRPMNISSEAFAEGGRIPVRHTCDGKDLSPSLTWTGVPQETKSLALIADDPDAPLGTFVHWVLYDLPIDLPGLLEGAEGAGVGGVNDFRRTGYGGPCPPKGTPHRYFYKLYALDSKLELPPGATKAEVEQAMAGHILEEASLMGIYER